MAVDAVAILAASQSDTAAERRLIIDMCIARLKNHQENADKIQRAFWPHPGLAAPGASGLARTGPDLRHNSEASKRPPRVKYGACGDRGKHQRGPGGQAQGIERGDGGQGLRLRGAERASKYEKGKKLAGDGQSDK